MIVLYIFGEEILLLFGASANTLSYAKDYLNIYLLGTIFVQLSVGMNYFINCQGYAKFGMLTLVIGGALNIILDPIFIFTLNMGVAGAALATIISQFVSFNSLFNPFFGSFFLVQRPFQSKRRDHIKAIATTEVIAQFDFGANA